jgi:hypothetical protein
MRIVARFVAAALVASAAGLALPAPAAYAGACSTDSGVTVVVDFNQLGGGVQQACVAGGGGDAASSLFPAAGFSLDYAQRQPGFVCRVEGVPQSDPCINTAPADAFWSLWWSDGSGSWSYASVGAGSLNVPDGGFVAFSWDQSAGSESPSAGATTPAPPKPTQPTPDDPGSDESQEPAAPNGPGPSSADPSSGTDADPSASPGEQDDPMGTWSKPGKGKSKQPKASPDATPSATESTPAEAAVDEGAAVAEPATESDGLPGWVAPALIAALFGVAGVVLLLRRRRAGPSPGP